MHSFGNGAVNNSVAEAVLESIDVELGLQLA
jgi:hypothetical protein